MASPRATDGDDTTDFRFVGGRICLDFVATLGKRHTEPVERLPDPAALVRWLGAAGLRSADSAAPAFDETGLVRARMLREAVDRLIRAGCGAGRTTRTDAAVVNRVAAHPDLVPQLAAGESGPGVRWAQGRDAGAALATVARDAGAAAGRAGVGRVKECGGPDLLAALPGRLPGGAAAVVLDGPLREPRQGRGVPGAGPTGQHGRLAYASDKKDSLFLGAGCGQPGGVTPRPISPRFLALAGTAVLWASAFPAIRVAVAGLGVPALSLLRLATAALALAVVAPPAGVRRPAARDLPLIAVCGATGMTAYQVLLNWGEVHVPAGTASLVIAAAPVFSVLLGSAFLGEPLTGRVLAGSAIALGGCAVVALAGGAGGFSAGALIVLAAAAAQGVYHCATKPLLRRYSGLEVATYAMVAGTVLALPLLGATVHGLAHAPAGAVVAAVYLGLLPSALGFVIWGYAVARLPLATATAALYLVPPIALAVSFVWLSEAPGPAELAGGAVTVAGVVLINRRRGGAGAGRTHGVARARTGRSAPTSRTGRRAAGNGRREGRRPSLTRRAGC